MKWESIDPELLSFIRDTEVEGSVPGGFPVPEEILRNRREWANILSQPQPASPAVYHPFGPLAASRAKRRLLPMFACGIAAVLLVGLIGLLIQQQAASQRQIARLQADVSEQIRSASSQAAISNHVAEIQKNLIKTLQESTHNSEKQNYDSKSIKALEKLMNDNSRQLAMVLDQMKEIERITKGPEKQVDSHQTAMRSRSFEETIMDRLRHIEGMVALKTAAPMGPVTPWPPDNLVLTGTAVTERGQNYKIKSWLSKMDDGDYEGTWISNDGKTRYYSRIAAKYDTIRNRLAINSGTVLVGSANGGVLRIDLDRGGERFSGQYGTYKIKGTLTYPDRFIGTRSIPFPPPTEDEPPPESPPAIVFPAR